MSLGHASVWRVYDCSAACRAVYTVVPEINATLSK